MSDCKYKYKGKFYTQEQLANLPEFKIPFANQQMERDQINHNTGTETDHVINFFPAIGDESADPEAGIFTKFIQFKKSQLIEYQKRLNNTEAKKRAKGLSKIELDKLNKTERELKLQIEGNYELGIKGLKLEIAELERNANVDAVGYYAEKDLGRLEKLARSSDIDDLREAQRIVDFYDLAGTFNRRVENPFFTKEEIFLEDENGNLTDEYRLSDQTMDIFKDWRDRAMLSQNIIDKRKEEVTVNTINSDNSVKKIYGDKKDFSFNELTQDETGLKDTDLISMWTMDITNGIFSTNGIIPQVMFSYLFNSIQKKLSWAKDIEEKIDKLNPGVQKELIKLGYSLRGVGIIGLKGASFQLFKERSKEGNETGGLVQRFAKEYFDSELSAKNKFHEKFEEALLYQDFTLRNKNINKVFEDYKKWRRNNSIIIDVNNIPELLTTTTPEADAHKAYLTGILGKKGYTEQVEKQKDLIRKYESEKQSTLDTLLVMENKNSFNDLSAKSKSNFTDWENNHNPNKGIEDYNSATGIFSVDNRKINNFMDYNVFIPRKNRTTISVNPQTSQYVFSENGNSSTGHYTPEFEKIESNKTLSDFYDVIKEVCDTIREVMPYELQQKITANTLPALMKTSTEIIADKNTGTLSALFLSFRNLIERIRIGFGVIKQSEISYATTDPITGRSNYKVNDQFLRENTKAVSQRMTIEAAKFIQAYNTTIAKDNKISKIRRFTVLPLSVMNDSTLVLLANYLHIDNSSPTFKADIQAITGANVEVGKYIRDFSLHSVVQSQSFDLAKIGKYFSNMAMNYAARQESLPILEIMKQHYDSIRKPKTNNLGSGIYNANDEEFMKEGFRTNAMRQMDDWFERVALDNYGTKHLGPHGIDNPNSPRIQKIEARIQAIDQELAGIKLMKSFKKNNGSDKLIAEKERLLIKKVIPYTYGKSIYTSEEKKKLGEIENLLRDENLSEDRRAELIKTKETLGRVRTATAAIDNLWSWIRTLRLGYNVSSATTNFLEGVTSNMIIGSTGDYFDPKEIYYGYNIVKHSFLKNATFGLAETGLARKNRKLMDKYNVIMDSKNELQKSSVKTYASKFSWLNPHELNQRVEYINQSPVMIAMLRTQKIKSNTDVESSIWDAMDKNGKLKDGFRTDENINNWENLTGDDYLAFKQKLHKAIVIGHGNYDELRGMMIKSNSAGKALAMFKTWIPMQFYWRFATEQDDIQAGTIGFKGKYWSYGASSAATHLGVVGLAAFGPLGAIAGGALGGLLGNWFGTDSGVGFLKETIETNKQLFKKALGMPINLLSGRQLINTNKAFDNWVGKGDFTANDAKAMRANMADLSMQLAWIGLILVAKSLFWDDDDEPDSPERIAHNILVNKLMQLSSQAGMYVNPVDTYKSTIGSNAVIQYCTDLGKELHRVSEYLHGRDIISSGINAGESGLWNQTKKTFLPGIFKDNKLGFETQAEKVFEESPFHPYFKSGAKLDQEANKRDRAERRLELENTLDIDDYEGETTEEKTKAKEKEIRTILDKEAPTPSKLKKLGLTREEYEEQNQ